MKKDGIVYVGFWRSDEFPNKPKRPMCEEGRKNKKVLKRLLALENAPQTESYHYKGSSPCRICGAPNGSGEYGVAIDGVLYVWPSGLTHYLEVHGMIPSKSLYRMLHLKPKSKQGEKK